MDPAAAQSKLQGPAIALIAYGAISIMFACLSIFSNILAMTGVLDNMMAEINNAGAGAMFSGVGGIAIALPGLLISVVEIVGGMKMKKTQSYGLAMAASVLAILPVCGGCCCFIGAPIGIWAIVTLVNDEVKAAFQANAASAM